MNSMLKVQPGLVGLGVYTPEPVAEGEVVLRAHISQGEIGPECTAETLQIGPGEHLLHPLIKRLNHSCDPTIVLSVEGDIVVGRALKPLMGDTELTFHYSTMDEGQAFGGLKCACGSPGCLGTLNGYNGLSWRQASDLSSQFSGHIRELHLQRVISRGHSLMDDGVVSACGPHLAAGGCTCCTFQQGNWIGLMPGEGQYLDAENHAGWSQVRDGEGIVCSKNPAGCDHKPLDCKLYPFFPYAVTHDGEGGFLVHLGAGDMKCSAKADLINNLKREIEMEELATSPLPFADHLLRSAFVGLLLYRNNLSDWMQETMDGYVGYSKGYSVHFSGKQELLV